MANENVNSENSCFTISFKTFAKQALINTYAEVVLILCARAEALKLQDLLIFCILARLFRVSAS